MNTIIRSLLAALALGLATSAVAAPPVGTGGGYYGSAWFDSGQGIIVGAYPTWYECNQQLQSGIQYRVTNWGWTVTELNGCAYRPPFGTVIKFEKELAVRIEAPDAEGSLVEAERILRSIERLRARYDIDAYEAELAKLQ